MAVRRGVVWLVVAALVIAQALGLMHRVVHPSPGPDSLHAQMQHVELASAQPGAGWVASLFAGHDDGSTCRLFDPLAHSGMPAVPAVLLPAMLASFFIDFFQGESLARWAALFDARGPPSLR